MLIDAFAANPDAAEFHEIDVDASPDVVYRALLTADFSRAPIVRALLGLRSLPDAASRRDAPAYGESHAG